MAANKSNSKYSGLSMIEVSFLLGKSEVGSSGLVLVLSVRDWAPPVLLLHCVWPRSLVHLMVIDGCSGSSNQIQQQVSQVKDEEGQRHILALFSGKFLDTTSSTSAYFLLARTYSHGYTQLRESLGRAIFIRRDQTRFLFTTYVLPTNGIHWLVKLQYIVSLPLSQP